MSEKILTKTVAMPSDTNPNGDIFGGWLLSQMDVAGGILAKSEASGRVATVAIDSMKFLLPVKVGDTVRYVGKPDDELEWGYHQFDDPNERLLLGNTYLVETIEIVSSYPRISLIGVKGHFHISFFEKATGCIKQAQPLQ